MDPEGLEVEDLLQLFLDLMFLDQAVFSRGGGGGGRAGLLAPEGEQRQPRQKVKRQQGGGVDLRPAYDSLAGALMRMVSQRGFKARTKAARSLAGASEDVQKVIIRAQALCSDALAGIVSRSMANFKCFVY